MKILGLSARKSGGKTTAANFVLGVYLIHYGIVRGQFTITPEGHLWVSDIFGDESHEGILNQSYHTDETIEFWQNNIWPHVKLYSWADLLKQNVCIEVLGLTYDQCYGTNEQKNSLTKYKWEDMPGIVSNKLAWDDIETLITSDVGMFHEPGPMTARDIMQYVGTNIFRKMFGNVWVDALLNRIKIEQPELAIITDCRFPNEVEGIKNLGGKTIRLTRAPFKEDEHESEKALDNKIFHWSNFDSVITNSAMDIPQQNEAMYRVLRSWDYIPELEE